MDLPVYLPLPVVNPLSSNAPYFVILLCLMPDNFTHQEKVLDVNGLKTNFSSTARKECETDCMCLHQFLQHVTFQHICDMI